MPTLAELMRNYIYEEVMPLLHHKDEQVRFLAKAFIILYGDQL